MGIRYRNRVPSPRERADEATIHNQDDATNNISNDKQKKSSAKRQKTLILPTVVTFLLMVPTLNIVMRRETLVVNDQLFHVKSSIRKNDQHNRDLKNFPRVIILSDRVEKEHGLAGKPQRTQDWPHLLQQPATRIQFDLNHPQIFDSTAESLNTLITSTQPPAQDLSNDTCIPMTSWQTASYPTCNNLHDLDMRGYLLSQSQDLAVVSSPQHNNNTNSSNQTIQEMILQPDLSMLAQGWFRATWKWRSKTSKNKNESTEEIVVLKTLRLEREFLSEYYDLHNRDAVAMERLTFSPYVVNVYGYCGQSALNEFADFPYGQDVKSLEKLSRRMRGKRDARAMMLRLVIAAGLAQGLAHVHRAGLKWEVDDPKLAHKLQKQQQEPALMVHYDINPRNIALFRGGRPKINDFNIAEFIQCNPQTFQPCGFKSRMHGPWWRSPEEVRVFNGTETVLLNEKVDVYALGSTLFHLFSSYSPRGRMRAEREKNVRYQVEAGIAPVLLPEFQNATDAVSQAFRHVLEKCHMPLPEDRWSAQQIATFFYEILRENREELMKLIQQETVSGGQQQDSTSSLAMNNATEGEDDDEEEELLENKG